MIPFSVTKIQDMSSKSFKPFKTFKLFDRTGVTPIDWTAKRRNLECRSNEFFGLILSDSLRLAVFLAKARFGRLSD
jgi:hypothetical protein